MNHTEGAGEPPGQGLVGVANHFEHANIDVANFVLPDGRPSKERRETLEKEFIDGVNARSRWLAKPSIMKGYGNEFLEPINEVAPELSKTNFFRGGCALDEVEYSVINERGRLTAKEKKKEISVHLETVHSNGRYIVFVGGAGSGKTTLLKRYCLLVLEGKIELMKEVKFIHVINIKDWSLKNGKYTPKELLYAIFNVASGEAVKYGFEWLKNPENQKKSFLVLDGLDTAPWVLSEDMHHNMINYDDKAPVPVIIYNILCGNLFPYCKILLASREYGINRLPKEIRPDSTIALRGLSRNSIISLVKDIGKDKGGIILESMLKKSLKLMLLCSTPLFLIFVIILYINGEDIPENLSGLIMTILKNHIRSKHLKVRKDVDKIMQNLMALSLDGMERGIVVFTKYDFEKHDLDIDDIKDLVISVPTPDKNIVCDQNLLEEDYSFFFVHQTIQELLAACEMANLNLLQYKELIDKQIHTSKYGVVRQMLCGLLFNKSTAKMSFLKNHYRDDYIIETKQEYLLDSLRKDLNGGNIPPMRMLNILICLCECGADERIVQLAKTNIKKIYLSGIPLTTSDLHALGSVTYHCDRLSIMALDNCQLNTYDLKVLSDELGDSDVEITVFDVCFNRSLLKNSMYYLHKICIRGQGLNYWQCGFRQSDILDFDEKTAKNAALDVYDVTVQGATEEQQIKTMLQDQNILDFSDYNTQHNFRTLKELIIIEANTRDSVNVSLTEYERNSDLTNLCQLLNQCIKIGEFKISECELTKKQLKQIMQAIPEQEIQMVNVFLTPDIQPNGWKIIGKITKTFKAKTLAVTSCSLTKEKLAELKLSLKQLAIDRFDLSRNSNMDVSCLNQVGEIIRNCATNDLVMGYCNLTSNQMSSLKASLQGENGPAKLHRIDISGNNNLGVDGFKALGQISDMCETKDLDVSECDPSPQEIRSFKDAVNTEKLTKLNVSRNRNMGEWGLYYIGELVGKCKLKTLFVRQCELEEKTLAKFAEGMKKAKIDLLSFGLYFMKPRITTQAEIDILLNLLPNVNKELTLDAWSFGLRKEEYEKLLQDELDKLEFIEPGVKIVFERGQKRYVQQRKPSA